MRNLLAPIENVIVIEALREFGKNDKSITHFAESALDKLIPELTGMTLAEFDANSVELNTKILESS